MTDGQIDAAMVTYVLEHGKGAPFVKMSSATYNGWVRDHHRSVLMWSYRGIPIKLCGVPDGEVECGA